MGAWGGALLGRAPAQHPCPTPQHQRSPGGSHNAPRRCQSVGLASWSPVHSDLGEIREAQRMGGGEVQGLTSPAGEPERGDLGGGREGAAGIPKALGSTWSPLGFGSGGPFPERILREDRAQGRSVGTGRHAWQRGGALGASQEVLGQPLTVWKPSFGEKSRREPETCASSALGGNRSHR